MAAMMREEPDGATKHWHLDKRVNLSIIITIIIQTAALLIWGTRLDSRVEVLERRHVLVEPQAERIIRLETKVDGIDKTLGEIKTILQPPPRR